MSNQIYQKSALISALVLAAISLPIGIIGFTREPTIIENYYNDYYYSYNNHTYYGSNETDPDYSKRFETFTYYDVYKGFNITRAFNLSTHFLYHFVKEFNVPLQ
jgi:hypothetical protein